MKIGIITLPFNSNYGGILQAYAIQSILKKMGHQVYTINRMSKGMPFKMKVLSFGKRFILKYFFGIRVVVRTWSNKKEKAIIAQHTMRFIRENISLTHFLKSEIEIKSLNKYNFDAYVVGSDQVWRPRYSPNIANHFLQFVPIQNNVKRISFAPSFGVDHWEYSPKQTAVCKKLIQHFDYVSVREKSGQLLCQKHLEKKAIHIVDPTMLIDKEEYIKLVEKDKLPDNKNKILTYILDRNTQIDNYVKKIEKELQMDSFSTMPQKFFKFAGKKNLEKCIFPPVTAWIKGFIDAEFVITDSFHGTVFSILFNKPFISLGNSKRGMSRFKSLLEMFDLEDRLISENDYLNDFNTITKINYEKVNQVLKIKQHDAISFLKSALKN
jgi:hypothetical protein